MELRDESFNKLIQQIKELSKELSNKRKDMCDTIEIIITNEDTTEITQQQKDILLYSLNSLLEQEEIHNKLLNKLENIK